LANLEQGKNCRERQDDVPGRRDGSIVPMAEDMEAGEDQVGDQDEEQEKMEGRIEPAVVLEILSF
jgi:hypothetical protein